MPASGLGGAAVQTDQGKLGVVFFMLLLWQLFELGRPPTPSGLPLLLAGVMFFDWLFKKDKQWSASSVWWVLLLGTTGLGILFAANTYSAAFSTRWMATTFLGVCLPLQALVNSPRRLRWWVYGFLAVALWTNGFAATHGGWGPAGAWGAQDENYMATFAGMAIPVAYFSMFVDKRPLARTLFVLVILVSVATVAVGQNPSRGGFLGLCAVGLYCLMRSPRKLLGFGIVGVLGVAMLALAPQEFWDNIRTTTDTTSGTADMRIEIWKTGVRMWQANPIFGVGGGNFRWRIGDYQSLEQFEKFGRGLGGSIVAHSFHVELLAELGLAGIIGTWALVITTWRKLGKVRDSVPAKGAHPDMLAVRCYADATRGAILAVLVNGVFLSLLFYSHLWLFLALGGAIPFVHQKLEKKLKEGEGTLSQSQVPGRRTGYRPGVVRPYAPRMDGGAP